MQHKSEEADIQICLAIYRLEIKYFNDRHI